MESTIRQLLQQKIQRIQKIISNTLSCLNTNREQEWISNSDIMVCTTSLVECSKEIHALLTEIQGETHVSEETNRRHIDKLQHIQDNLSMIIGGYGTQTVEDLMYIVFGGDAVASHEREKSDIICAYVKPTGYKKIKEPSEKAAKKKDKSKKTTTTEKGEEDENKQKEKENNGMDPHHVTVQTKSGEDMVAMETASCWECFDNGAWTKGSSVIPKVFGIRFLLVHPRTKQRIIVQGIVEDVVVECMRVGQSWIQQRKTNITEYAVNRMGIDPDLISRVVECMTIKDFLVWSDEDMSRQALTIQSEAQYVNQTNLSDILKRFTSSDLMGQRQLLMALLIHSGPIAFHPDCKKTCVPNIAYILYDLMSSSTASTSLCLLEQQQQQQQNIVLNPYAAKTNNAASSKYDTRDQQLLFYTFPWKVRRYFKHVMDYTMQYTNEMVNRYDVSRVSLEQQVYVMKAPESVREKAMIKLKEIRGKADDSGAKAKQYLEGLLRIPFGMVQEETLLKRASQLRQFHGKNDSVMHIREAHRLAITNHWEKCQTEWLPQLNAKEVAILYKTCLPQGTKKSKTDRVKELIREYLSPLVGLTDNENEKIHLLSQMKYNPAIMQPLLSTQSILTTMQEDIQRVRDVLDASIYGHDHAKKQILKIVGQWMTGEQTGYCFGFEGAPGVGKTSLAKKGLSRCLYDEATKTSRPFVFIALGGTCNGSTLEGHSYTYVNSTWGRIVDALMDAKCMNPIIYIDELDKVSKTEHGKEIIGILMHLIDTTQNTGFQDKYFSGIDIDLSKALFIFSYNDASQIDSILLDRIHRIKFDALTVDDKKVIIRQYIVPDIERKMGMAGCVSLSEEIMEFLIETYTAESGVRKLKEVLFDLYGEINIRQLCALDDNNNNIKLPLHITEKDIRDVYLKKYTPVKHKKIGSVARVGMIHGLWANGLGQGGIIPIQATFFPTTTFLDLKLTGQQGDVMKESMNVAKSLAWQLVSSDKQKEWILSFETSKCQGVHIHCPDGATPKDGPSAGAAITLALYSLLMGMPIRPEVAITGEITLQGNITEIGGLEQKIWGGIRAGITHFLYPKENAPDFKKIMEKYGHKAELQNISFTEVEHIAETFQHVFV